MQLVAIGPVSGYRGSLDVILSHRLWPGIALVGGYLDGNGIGGGHLGRVRVVGIGRYAAGIHAAGEHGCGRSLGSRIDIRDVVATRRAEHTDTVTRRPQHLQ